MRGPIRILGVDPGLRRCGWGVVVADGARLTHVAHGVIAPPVTGAMAARLIRLLEALEAVVAEHAPDCAAVEESFVARNAGSALKLGQARAAALLAPARAGLPVAEYAPREIKKAVVGVGGAEKAQVAAMVAVLLPGCRAEGDAADALAIAICHAHSGLARGRLAAVS